MTNIKQAIILSTFIFLLAGCNEYTTPLCSTANRVDIPGFEGEHVAESYYGNDHPISSNPVTISRSSEGTYILNGSPFSTCAFKDAIVGEISTPENKTYSTFFFIPGKTFFELILGSLDKSELDAAGIPSTLVDFPGSPGTLVTDNSKVPNETFLKFLHPTSIAIRIY